jgi:hypothetical protein
MVTLQSMMGEAKKQVQYTVHMKTAIRVISLIFIRKEKWREG